MKYKIMQRADGKYDVEISKYGTFFKPRTISGFQTIDDAREHINMRINNMKGKEHVEKIEVIDSNDIVYKPKPISPLIAKENKF
jgi:hypothetical protein